MLDIHSAAATPTVTLRENYREPDWLIPEISLTFDLRAEETRVHARLTAVRNGHHNRPLRLDGDDLTPLLLRVDGKEVDSWSCDTQGLTVALAGEQAVVETEVVIHPAANTRPLVPSQHRAPSRTSSR